MANSAAVDRLKARQATGHSTTVFSTLDALTPVLSTPGRNNITLIKSGLLDDFSGHTFKHGFELSEYEQSILDSIKENGIMEPLLVRRSPSSPERYEIIAGHTRRRLAKIAGLDEMPCIVRDLDDNEAVVFMVESNLQRPDWLPSEKAASYKAHYNATANGWDKLRGRPRRGAEGNSVTELPNYSADRLRDVVAQRFNISGVMLMTYIKLNDLKPALLDMVDEKRITVKAGYQLAFLDANSQDTLLSWMNRYPHIKIDERKATDIRACDQLRWPDILGIRKVKKDAEPQVRIALPFKRLRVSKDEFNKPEFIDWLVDLINSNYGKE